MAPGGFIRTLRQLHIDERMPFHLDSLAESCGKRCLEEWTAFYKRVVLTAFAARVDGGQALHVLDEVLIDDPAKPRLGCPFQVNTDDAGSVAQLHQLAE